MRAVEVTQRGDEVFRLMWPWAMMLAAAAWMLVVTTRLAADPGPQAMPAETSQTVPPERARRAAATMTHCQVFLIHDTELSAKESGTITAIHVREGDEVRAGTMLACIDDRQAQYDKLSAELKRDAALAKSQDDIEVRFAEAAFGVADAELNQSLAINRHTSNAVSGAEIRRLRLTRQKAQLQIDRSRLELKIAGMTADVETTAVAAAEERIRRRQVMAPFDGIVLEVKRDPAEWVKTGDPLLRLIRLDRLRVEGFLQVREFNPEEVAGRNVTVAVQRARGQVVRLPGRVVFVSPTVQAGDKYRIRAEVENRLQDHHWVLRPGMSATMSIDVGQTREGSARGTTP